MLKTGTRIADNKKNGFWMIIATFSETRVREKTHGAALPHIIKAANLIITGSSNQLTLCNSEI